MKKFTLKKMLVAVIALLCSVAVSAHDFMVDGIYYNVISETDLTVEVTFEGKRYNISKKYSGDVVIPDKVSYNENIYSVTSIGKNAFNGCSALTSVTIPNSVTSIGGAAFGNCSSLKTVINFSNLIFTEWSSDYGSIAYYADKVINLPNGTLDGDFVFCEVDSVNTLYAYIGDDAEITLPENCKGENYVIGKSVFQGCSALTSVTIPNSVTSIGESAFYYCPGLISVIIGNSVTSIGDGAFMGCSDLTSIYVLNETPAGIESQTFSNYDATLYVPQGSLAAYKAADYWKNFANIEEFDPTGIEDVTDDAPTFEVTAGGIQLTAAEGKAVAVYTAGGTLVEKIDAYAGEEITLDEGVYIVRVGKKAVKVKL